MLKIILIIISAIILIILHHFFPGYGFSSYAFITIIMVVFVDFLLILIKNRNRIYLYIKCKYLSLRGECIRVSMAYIYRIKINDRYLLVENHNFGGFQPVGGKYKKIPTTHGVLDQKFGIKDDVKLSTCGKMKDDFAFSVPAGKVLAFLDWFNTKKDREISHWREFYEELIKTDILTKEKFPYINYNYIGTIRTPIKKSKGWDCFEILQHDVLDLLPTKEQKKELEKLLELGDSEKYKWADTELINCLGYDSKQRKKIYDIKEHTKWALNMKYSKT